MSEGMTLAERYKRDLRHYLPHMVGATLLVTALPSAAVYGLQNSGIVHSLWQSSILGVAFSLLAAAAGSALWKCSRGSSDLVFGDLMLWSYLRRIRNEKDVAGMIGLLEKESDDVTPDRRIEILQKLAAALEARDPYTHGHTRRVARHSEAIAKAMGLPRETVTSIRTAAAVHDVGKMDIPDEVLNKAGQLTDEEFETMKLHSVYGADMVQDVGDPQLTSLVRHHHERIDGRGYPDRLAGDEIPLGARIIAVADTFDAITSTRSYRTACHHKKAIEILEKESGSQLDPKVVDAFLSYYSGRNSVEWWAVVTTGPQRLLGKAITWLQSSGATTLANTAAATGLAAAVGGAAFIPGIANRSEPVPRTREAPATVAQTMPFQDPAPSGDPREEQSPAHSQKEKAKGIGGKTGSDGGPNGSKGVDSGGSDPGSNPGDPGPSSPGSPSSPGAPSSDDPGTAPDSGGEPAGGLGGIVDDTTDVMDDVVDDTTGVVDDVVDDVIDVIDDPIGGIGDVVDGIKLP